MRFNESMRIAVISLLCAGLCAGAVKTLYVQERTDYENGKDSGSPGPYEHIVAKATLSDGSVGIVDVLKPRDPARGNQTLVLVMAPEIPAGELVQRGYTILRVAEHEPNIIRAVISFLRYDGSPFLLGDQPKFLKHAIAVISSDAAPDIQEAIDNGSNRSESGKPLVEGVLVYGSGGDLKPSSGLTVGHAQRSDFGPNIDKLQSAVAK